MEAQSTQNLIEVSEIKNDAIILKSGGLRQILIVSGMNFALKSDEEQNLILGAYQNFLNSIDFPFQIVIHSRKVNIEKYLNMVEERKNQEANPLLRSQIEEYQQFVADFVKLNAIMMKNFFVVVPYESLGITPAAGGVLSSVTSFLPFGPKKSQAEVQKQAAQTKEEEFQKNMVQLRQRVDRVVSGLRTIGLNVSLLNNDSLIELFYNLYNPETVEKKKEEIIGKNA